MRPIGQITNEMIEKRNEYLMLICSLAGIAADDVMSKKRDGNVAMARHLLMWSLYNLHGYTTMQIGTLTRRHYSTVIYAVNVVNNYHIPKKMEDMKIKIKNYYKNKTLCKKNVTTA